MNQPTPEMPQPTPSVVDLLKAFKNLDAETAILVRDATLGDRFQSLAPKLHSYLSQQVESVFKCREDPELDGVVVHDPDWRQWSNTELGQANAAIVALIPSGATERHREFLETVARAVAIAVLGRLAEPGIQRAKNYESN